MDTTSKLKNKYVNFTEGLVIAAVPIAAYFLAYLYERGYCEFYNIPFMYIDISLINIASTFIAVISTYALFVYFFSELIQPFLDSIHRSIKWSIIKIFLVIFALVGFSIVFNWSLPTSITIILSTLGLLIFLEFIFPLLTQTKTPGYINKIEAQKEIDFKHDSVIDKFIIKYGLLFFTIVYVFYLLSIATYFAGGANARFKTMHLVPTNESNIVYLRKYGDFLISSKFDRSTNMLLNEFVAENMEGKSLKTEQLGQLVPFQKKPNN